MFSRKSWKDAANGPIKKTYEDLVASPNNATRYFTIVKRISSTQMDEKRRKRLFYHCEYK